MAYPTKFQAGQAAELLGVDLFDLMHALRDFAEDRFRAEIGKTRDYEQPNFGRARRAMAAAIACDEAYAEEVEARQEASV